MKVTQQMTINHCNTLFREACFTNVLADKEKHIFNISGYVQV